MLPEPSPGEPAFNWVTAPTDAVEVGRVSGAFGVSGWLHIQSYSASADALFHAPRWLLSPSGRWPRPDAAHSCIEFSVAELRPHGDALVVSLEGIADRTLALRLKGAAVMLPRSAFPPAEEGEYYWVDLIGCAVTNRDGLALGAVTGLMETGAQQVLVVGDGAGATRRERLIPFVEAYIDSVDVATRRIVVDWQPDY